MLDALWIVRLALSRPYTFVVVAMLIVLLGIVSILRMPKDIFPEIAEPIAAEARVISACGPGGS